MGLYLRKNFEEEKQETYPEEVLTTDEILSSKGKGISVKCFRTIFPHFLSENRNLLAEINKYLSVFDDLEVTTLAQVMMEYRDYLKNPNNNKTLRYVDYFKATKFVLNIQGGKSKFESYIDVHYTQSRVKEYKESQDNDTEFVKLLRQEIATAAAAYGNSRLVLVLAQALDAPIQISYQGYKNQMIETLRDIATDKKASPKVKMEAAKALLEQLNPNNLSTLQINLGKEEKQSFINDARSALKMLAEKKLELFQNENINKTEIINVDIIKESQSIKEPIKEPIIDAKIEEEKELTEIAETLKLEEKKDE